jgi:hypothetical protein
LIFARSNLGCAEVLLFGVLLRKNYHDREDVVAQASSLPSFAGWKPALRYDEVK